MGTLARYITFFITSLLLLTAAEERSLFSSISPDSVSQSPVSTSPMTVGQTWINDGDGACKGIERTECVIKTAMVAHTDYVYTQDIINGP